MVDARALALSLDGGCRSEDVKLSHSVGKEPSWVICTPPGGAGITEIAVALLEEEAKASTAEVTGPKSASARTGGSLPDPAGRVDSKSEEVEGLLSSLEIELPNDRPEEAPPALPPLALRSAAATEFS